jgi:uncharacterized protein
MKETFRVTSRLCLLLLLAAACTFARADAKEMTDRAETAIRSGDVVTAMNLLRQSADAGYAPAQARLADMLDAAEQNAEAVALYRKSADQNDPSGMVGLGRMLAQGKGIARDPAQAVALYRKAAAMNHWEAYDMLARAYRAGDLGLSRDLAEAGRMDQRAKELREAAAKVAK